MVVAVLVMVYSEEVESVEVESEVVAWVVEV